MDHRNANQGSQGSSLNSKEKPFPVGQVGGALEASDSVLTPSLLTTPSLLGVQRIQNRLSEPQHHPERCSHLLESVLLQAGE